MTKRPRFTKAKSNRRASRDSKRSYTQGIAVDVRFLPHEKWDRGLMAVHPANPRMVDAEGYYHHWTPGTVYITSSRRQWKEDERKRREHKTTGYCVGHEAIHNLLYKIGGDPTSAAYDKVCPYAEAADDPYIKTLRRTVKRVKE